MNNAGNSLRYIGNFADICEYIPLSRMNIIVPKVLDVLPYVLECEFGVTCGDKIDKIKHFIYDGAIESALIEIVPQDIIVSSTMQRPWTFTFACNDWKLVDKTFTSRAPTFGMAMLCAFLRYLCECKSIHTDGGDAVSRQFQVS